MHLFLKGGIMENELDLEREIEEARERRNERLRKRYQLLRQLGFSSQEAAVLQHKSKKIIEKFIEKKSANS